MRVRTVWLYIFKQESSFSNEKYFPSQLLNENKANCLKFPLYLGYCMSITLST